MKKFKVFYNGHGIKQTMFTYADDKEEAIENIMPRLMKDVDVKELKVTEINKEVMEPCSEK